MHSEDLFELSCTDVLSLSQKITELPEEHSHTELKKANQLVDAVDSSRKSGEKTRRAPIESCLIQLPMSKIRNIMKLDNDLQMVSNEIVFMVTRATELFIQSFATEAFSHCASSKKKIIQKQDIERVLESNGNLEFLDGALNF